MDEDMPEDDPFDDNKVTKEEGVYSDCAREGLVEDDEITPEEEGFMEGAEDDGQKAKCASCGKMLTPKNTVERDFEGELKWFCSEHCADKFEEKHKEE